MAANTNASADDALLLCDASVGVGFTVTLPNAAAHSGRILTIQKIDAVANPVTIASAGGAVLGSLVNPIVTQYSAITVQSDGVNWYMR